MRGLILFGSFLATNEGDWLVKLQRRSDPGNRGERWIMSRVREDQSCEIKEERILESPTRPYSASFRLILVFNGY